MGFIMGLKSSFFLFLYTLVGAISNVGGVDHGVRFPLDMLMPNGMFQR